MTTLTTYSKEQIIGQIMALEGRAAANPKKYHEHLQTLCLEKLSQRLTDLLSDLPEGASGTCHFLPEETTTQHCGALRRSGANTPATFKRRGNSTLALLTLLAL